LHYSLLCIAFRHEILVLRLCFSPALGCASGPRFDTRHPSVNYDNRVQFVVVHYTSASLDRSLALLTHGQVSSHYLIGDDASATIYKLVDESQRAWHAGESEWMGRTWLNSSSIGIEIVNPGYKDTPTGRLWYPYSAQVKSLVVLLKDISKRNGIDPKNIIGHSDIAPLRKLDPGPLFPWKRLAAEGLGMWPEAQAVARFKAQYATSCRALPGSRKSWPVWATRPLRPVSWMLPRVT
jgi:N-acetylmuramoyl-L-alanine amidase